MRDQGWITSGRLSRGKERPLSAGGLAQTVDLKAIAMPMWLWWMIGALCAVVFALLAFFNAWTVANYFRTRKHVSAIPLVGGIAGAIALSILPVNHLASWWWLPLLLDYGSLPMFVYFFARHVTAGLRKGEKP